MSSRPVATLRRDLGTSGDGRTDGPPAGSPSAARQAVAGDAEGCPALPMIAPVGQTGRDALPAGRSESVHPHAVAPVDWLKASSGLRLGSEPQHHDDGRWGGAA